MREPERDPEAAAGGRPAGSDGERIGAVARDGTGDRTLAGSESDVAYAAPVWSPDGRRVAYIRFKDGDSDVGRLPTYDVYVVGADGTGRRRLTRTPGVEGALDWSSR